LTAERRLRARVPLIKEWLTGYSKDDHAIYLVGGSTRDLLMGAAPKDVDVVLSGAKNLARRLAKTFGLAFVPMETKPDEPCYRVVDRGASARFLDIAEMRGTSIFEDLPRRDFTMNAIAIRITGEGDLAEIIDPLNGLEDIERKVIRQAGPRAFESDPLRTLRAFRFCAQLGFSIDESTQENIQAHTPLIVQCSAERILSELLLILGTSRSAEQFRKMDGVGLLEYIFPEIQPEKACEQGGYHHLNVWDHSLLVMKRCEHILDRLPKIFGDSAPLLRQNMKKNRRAEIVKLAALLHDVAKPLTKGHKKGRATFYGHAGYGADMVFSIAERLKMSARDRDFLNVLVAEHSHARSLSHPNVKPASLLRWFRKLDEDAPAAILLSLADSEAKCGPLSSGEARKAYRSWCIEAVHNYYAQLRVVLHEPSLLTGNDLIAMGLKPGPQIGDLLKETREKQDLGELKTREEALQFVRERIKDSN